jgi:hypothetical protein
MGEPTWSEIKKLRVPDRAGSVWMQVLDWVIGGKLYRIEVRPVTPHAETALSLGQKPQDSKCMEDALAKDVEKDKTSHSTASEKKVDSNKSSAQPVSSAEVKAPPTSATPTAVRIDDRTDESNSDAENLEEQSWTPLGSNHSCTADGDLTGLSRRDCLIVPGARLGALICKIGGSTADLTLDSSAVTVFAIGRFCVFRAPDEPKAGPMFLGANDSPVAAAQIQGSLEVVISVAL